MARFVLAAASVAALAALLVGGAVAEGVFAACAALFPVALIALGAARRGHLGGALGWTLVALLLLIGGGLGAAFALRGHVMSAPWVGGVPLALAAVLVLIWGVPLVLVGLVYGFTFDRHGLTHDDLEALRRRAGGAVPSGRPVPARGGSPIGGRGRRPGESVTGGGGESPSAGAPADDRPGEDR